MGLIAAPGADLDAALAGYTPHTLHTDERQWSQTSCYVDLWVEVLHAAGCDPLAGLSFTVAQDYEGDQFTFTKYNVEDLEILYGLAVQELSLYEPLAVHVREQAARGRMLLVEVDGYHLPDTRGLTYRQEHGKTTIGIWQLDEAGRRLGYFHNSGFYELRDGDYDAIFAPRPDRPDILPPYAEFVSPRGTKLTGIDLVHAAFDRLRVHLARRPVGNPVARYRAEFPAQLAMLIERNPAFFHQYAFNIVRQLGCNWELLASHLQWLADGGIGDITAAIAPALRIAEDAKALQFRLARLVSRKRLDPCTEMLDTLERSYDQAMDHLTARLG